MLKFQEGRSNFLEWRTRTKKNVIISDHFDHLLDMLPHNGMPAGYFKIKIRIMPASAFVNQFFRINRCLGKNNLGLGRRMAKSPDFMKINGLFRIHPMTPPNIHNPMGNKNRQFKNRGFFDDRQNSRTIQPVIMVLGNKPQRL